MEKTLSQAEEQELGYDWLGAIEWYQKAMSLVTERVSLRMGEIRECMGYAFFRAAMQAESSSEFGMRCSEAVECYEEARNLYDEFGSTPKAGRMLRCKSMIAYLLYWLASEQSEKKRLIESSWELAKDALEAFNEAGDGNEHGRTYNQLSASAGFDFVLQTNYAARETIVREAIECGEQAIALLSDSGEVRELATAYAKTALFLGWLGQYFVDLDERERCTRKSIKYWLKATTLCEEASLLGLLSSVPEAPFQFWGIGTDKALKNLKKGLEYANRTKDRFAIGCALDWLAFNLYWKATMCENQDEMLRLCKEALKFAQDAKRKYQPISFTSTRCYSFPIELADAVYTCELSNREVNVQKKRRFLEGAERAARNGLGRYKRAGYLLSILAGRHELSKVLLLLAKIEQNPIKKKSLLEEALDHRVQVAEGFERFLPFHYFDQGFMIGFLVATRCELADLTENDETRLRILEEAVAEKENSVKLGIKYVSFYEEVGSVPLIADVCRWQLEYGSLLKQVYSLNKDKSYLEKEVRALQSAAEIFRKLDLVSRVAECLWRIAQAHEALGEELEAARDFEAASKCFGRAAERIPQLEGFFQDKALYMQAWSEIEKAKHCHRKQENDQSKKHFEKAAELHKRLKQWRYLAPNYLGLAKLEYAEDLSRKERCREAIQAFEQAAMLFTETRKSVQKKLGRIENIDEEHMATDLLKASDLRHKYCDGRISIEKAKILHNNGENYASAQQYGLAIEVFETTAEASESEEGARELRFITFLSRAWQKMMLAEDRSMPTLYAEAAQLFEKASTHNSSDVERFQALGHSRFCRALEAGTRFLDVQEMATYSTAMHFLQSATHYYKMASLRNDVEHAKATELLFEACAYVNSAKREIDPEKKTKLYKMAEVALQASSGRYIRAKRPEERDEVLRLLKTVKEEQEWALSLAQVLRTPPLISVSSFPTPTPTSERPVGLNEFEHADVQAYLSAPKEAMVGDELNIRLDLINVAKSFGLLVRIDQLIPPSLKVVAIDPHLSIEDGSVEFRGKRLEPLRVESVKISAKAIQRGFITLSPKVVFVDDVGRFRTCKPKAIRVTINPRLSFKFEVKSAETILRFLAASFLEDYEKRRMPLDRCGWRSLGVVMKQGNVPRSCVYRVGGGRGAAVAELERRGLIEARVSSGERGRGGNVLRLRVCYEKEDVRRFVNEKRGMRKEEQG